MKLLSGVVLALIGSIAAAQQYEVEMCASLSDNSSTEPDCTTDLPACEEFHVGSCGNFTSIAGSVNVTCSVDDAGAFTGGRFTVFTSSDCTGAGQTVSFDNDVCFVLPADVLSTNVGVAARITCEHDDDAYEDEDEDDDAYDDDDNATDGANGTDGTDEESGGGRTAARPFCFADDAEVRLIDGSVKPLRELQVGDLVASYDGMGQATFSEVFLIQHASATQRVEMRRIEFSATDGSGSITVSGGHFLDGGADGRTIRADTLQVGDAIYVQGSNGARAKALVHAVSTVYAAPRNVHTMNDRVVVDGVLATPWTALEPVGVSTMKLRVLLLPLKGLYLLGLSPLVRSLDAIAHALVTASLRSSSSLL